MRLMPPGQGSHFKNHWWRKTFSTGGTLKETPFLVSREKSTVYGGDDDAVTGI